MFKKLFFIFFLFSSASAEDILKFFNKEYNTQTEGENDCLCDVDNEHCNYLCCCDTKCSKDATDHWEARSKCINEKDSIGIFRYFR